MIRLGISGCGDHGVHHAIAALHAGGFRIVAGHDSNPKAMQVLAARAPGMHQARSFDELLRHRKMDALLIASPDEYHYEQLMAALRGNPPVAAGLPMTPQRLHVMVDKPLACDPSQVATAIQAIERERQRGRIITSCHPRRFDPPYMWVADNLLRLVLRFGSLRKIHLNFEYGAPQAGWETARSLLPDHFSDKIDIVRYWLRDLPFEAVPVIYDRPDKYAASITLTTKRGAKIPVICAGSREGETRFDETITLHFDRAKVTIHATPGEILIRPQHGPEEILPESVPSNLGGRLVGVMGSFREAIQGDPDYLTASDLRVNTLAAAMLATGKTYTYQP